MDSAGAVTRSLRLASDLLGHEREPRITAAHRRGRRSIASDVSVANIEKQLERLEPFRLIDHDAFSVYCAPYHDMGCVMRQIAICREQTFRAVGEGTGRSLDSDRFDVAYWHLWIWDREAQKIVGGYRLGKTDKIIGEHGAECLYTHTQYRFDPAFLGDLGNPLEVGRSFVTPNYQRHPRALDLLWRGIGAFVARNPAYHTLFGCVSISSEYSELARAFLADTLMKNFSAQPRFLQRVTPRSPLLVKHKLWKQDDLVALKNISIANKLLGNLDRGKDIPVLFRHYLTLNGRFVSFSVNEQFNNSLNGLILVDLRKTPYRYLHRYLGKKGCADFLDYWNVDRQAA